jgi:hypothetical protein
MSGHRILAAAGGVALLATLVAGSASSLAYSAAKPNAPALATPHGFGSPQHVHSGNFDEVTSVVDSNGHVHIAASTLSEVWYFTNRTGGWTGTRAFGGTPFGYSAGSIALDSKNHVYIAAVRNAEKGDSGIWLVSDKGRTRGTFPAQPTEIAPTGNGEPQLKVFDGKLYLVDVATWCCIGDGTVQMRTNVTGSWTVSTIGRGQYPSFRMTPSGFARVAYERGDIKQGIYYAAAATHTGNFARAKVAGTGAADSGALLALDGNLSQIVWMHGGSPGSVRYAYQTAGGWHSAMNIPGTNVNNEYGFDVSTEGVPHVAVGDPGLTDHFRPAGSWGYEIITNSGDLRAISVRRALGGSMDIVFLDAGGDIWMSAD